MAASSTATDGGRATAVERHCLRAAGKLRLAYERLAAESSEVRGGELTAIVRESLLAVPAEDREVFLDGLREHFPTFGGGSGTTAAPVAAPGPSLAEVEKERKANEARLNDSAFLVSRLLAIAPSLNDAQKKQVAAQLAKAFPPPAHPVAPPAIASVPAAPARPAAPPPPPPQSPTPSAPAKLLDDGDGATALRRTLAIPGNQPIDSNRVAISLSLLFDLVTGIDEAAWPVWERTITTAQQGEPVLRRRMWLKPTLTRLIVGGPPGALAELTPAVTDLSSLTCGLIDAAGSGATVVGKHANDLAPERIEEQVRQGGYSLKSVEARCWDLYRRRFGETMTALPAGMAKATVRSVEFYVSGETK